MEFLKIIGVILLAVFIINLFSTLTGQSINLKYKYQHVLVTPDFLPSIFKSLFKFTLSLPNRIFNSNEFKLKKLIAERERIKNEIFNCEYEINNFINERLENEKRYDLITELEKYEQQNKNLDITEILKTRKKINELRNENNFNHNYFRKPEYKYNEELLIYKNQLSLINDKIKYYENLVKK